MTSLALVADAGRAWRRQISALRVVLRFATVVVGVTGREDV